MTEEGQLIHEQTHICEQAPSIILKNDRLDSGSYILIVDAYFNQSAEKDPTLKDVAVKISC